MEERNLKPNEIMVNDYIIVENLYIQPKNIKHLLDLERLYKSGKHIRPIPITDEILKKNGFRVVASIVGYYELESKDGRININNASNTLGRSWNIHIDNEDFDTIGSMDVEYVHQLQQVLRLCRIKEEIKL